MGMGRVVREKVGVVRVKGGWGKEVEEKGREELWEEERGSDLVDLGGEALGLVLHNTPR